jgi:hypothetical protein
MPSRRPLSVFTAPRTKLIARYSYGNTINYSLLSGGRLRQGRVEECGEVRLTLRPYRHNDVLDKTVESKRYVSLSLTSSIFPLCLSLFLYLCILLVLLM